MGGNPWRTEPAYKYLVQAKVKPTGADPFGCIIAEDGPPERSIHFPPLAKTERERCDCTRACLRRAQARPWWIQAMLFAIRSKASSLLTPLRGYFFALSPMCAAFAPGASGISIPRRHHSLRCRLASSGDPASLNYMFWLQRPPSL